jgi:hypothetical protein
MRSRGRAVRVREEAASASRASCRSIDCREETTAKRWAGCAGSGDRSKCRPRNRSRSWEHPSMFRSRGRLNAASLPPVAHPINSPSTDRDVRHVGHLRRRPATRWRTRFSRRSRARGIVEVIPPSYGIETTQSEWVSRHRQPVGASVSFRTRLGCRQRHLLRAGKIGNQ